MNKILLTLTLINFVFSSVASACFHFPSNYRGQVSQGLQEVFLFHDGENANMLIRTNLKAKKFPREIAWVLPFPSLPSKYTETSGILFDEMNSLFPDKGSFGGRGSVSAVSKQSSGAIKVHKTVTTENYKIQPIEILKDHSSKELNAWLKKNKFTPMPDELQKPYLKKGATFLAIRMQMNNTGNAEIQSKVLHVVYKDESLSVPVKFTHRHRILDLKIYVFSSKEIKKDFDTNYFIRSSSAPYENKGHLPFVDAALGKRNGYITLYTGLDLNFKDKDLSKLAYDPRFLKSEL